MQREEREKQRPLGLVVKTSVQAGWGPLSMERPGMLGPNWVVNGPWA